MSSFNILVVEDEDAIREMLMMVLGQAGFMPLLLPMRKMRRRFWMTTRRT